MLDNSCTIGRAVHDRLAVETVGNRLAEGNVLEQQGSIGSLQCGSSAGVAFNRLGVEVEVFEHGTSHNLRHHQTFGFELADEGQRTFEGGVLGTEMTFAGSQLSNELVGIGDEAVDQGVDLGQAFAGAPVDFRSSQRSGDRQQPIRSV